jgi:spermidine dehydrogenase
MDDKTLGMDRRIDRRDFLDGVALAVGALAAAPVSALTATPPGWPQDSPGYAPPLLHGMRGSHPGSFEGAHALRDGILKEGKPEDTGETYDLVVVGAGISGLAAAHFWREAQPGAKILILDNHDDFGGHAKRNEYSLGGKLHLMNGGTMEIDSPRPYGPVPAGLLVTLGIDPVALTKACDKPAVYKGLGHAVYYDKPHFGTDRLVANAPGRDDDDRDGGDGGKARWQAFVAASPLSDKVRADIVRIETANTDYMAGQTQEAKADTLSRVSHAAYLTDIVRADPGVLPFYQAITHGEWALGIDAVSALDCWGFGYSGYQGLKLTPKTRPRMSFTPAGYIEGGSDTFHFPDGNATIARLLVRRLVPGSIGGKDCTDIVTARCNYATLDRAGNAVRLRLSSIVVGAQHVGTPGAARLVDVTYVRGGKAYQVRGKAVVMAGYNAMIPYLVPALPDPQKAALHALVRAPLVYTSVALKNWQAFHRAGIRSIYAPGSFHSDIRLNWPVDIGGYSAERDPAKPILAFALRTPVAPGLSGDDQARAGRFELLDMPFSTFERETRTQFAAMLPGFDPANDITAITVNRWPHGYAPEYNYLWAPDVPLAEMPHIVGRQRFGRIAIANSDAGNGAYTDVAIEQGYRAVTELLGS